MRRYFAHFLILCCAASLLAQDATTKPQFTVTFTKEVSDKPFTGRVLIMLGRSGEPRNGPNWFGPLPFFAKDVKDVRPGDPIVIGNEAIGFPGPLAQLPAKEYVVQAVLDLDQSNTHRIGSAPGNGYSKPVTAMLDPKKGFNVVIKIDTVAKESPFRETD